MRRTLLLFIAALMVSTPMSTIVHGSSTHGNALILSSVDNTEPFGRYGSYITTTLEKIGYSVTTLTNQQITVDFLLSSLNGFDFIIWRTDDYVWAHTTYWYVGQHASQSVLSKYANDISKNALDVHAGIVGVNPLFFQRHFSTVSLSNVKLAVLLTSISNSLAYSFSKAGAHAVIFCLGDTSLQFGLIDDLATQVIAYLAMGYTLDSAIWTTITPYLSNNPPEDQLDTVPAPPFWYIGDGSTTIP
jgi:hypothetical protein